MQMKRPLLGDKGRWLTAGLVAIQIAILMPLLREGILLCYASEPGNPDTLQGRKQKMAQKIYKIVAETDMVFKFHTAAVMTELIFMPLYTAAGHNNHTNFGGSGGLVNKYEEAIKTLDDMVTVTVNGKKQMFEPNLRYFKGVFNAVEEDDASQIPACKRHIVTHVKTVKEALQKRFANLQKFWYRVAGLAEEEFVRCDEVQAYIKVPAAAAILTVNKLLQEWDAMPENVKQEMPLECRLLFEQQGELRRQLEQFARGDINTVTEKPEPYRKWPELAEHIVSFFEFRLNSSAYVEGRFSVASNAARTKPASTTKTMSQHIRKHSNSHATTYPSVVFFDDIDPQWAQGADPPELPRRMHHATVVRQYSFEKDWERLQPEAKRLQQQLKNKYTAAFIRQFQRVHTQDAQQDEQPEQPQPHQPVRRSSRQNSGQTSLSSDFAWSNGDESGDQEEESDAEDSEVEGGAEYEEVEEQQQQQQQQQQEEEDGSSEDEDDSPIALLSCRVAPGSVGKRPKTWRREDNPVQLDEWGSALPDENPLAVKGADFVWESPDGLVQVVLEKPLKKQPPSSSAHIHHDRPADHFKFYSRIRVTNDQGEKISFDLRKPTCDVAVVDYGEDASGDPIQIYADILGIYLCDNEPYIEHGYFYDRQEFVRDKPCADFLRKTERSRGRIADDELVNSVATYHSHAEVIQGRASVRHGKEDDLPVGDSRAFFWCRVIDISSNKEVPAARIQKMLQLQVARPHPSNVLSTDE